MDRFDPQKRVGLIVDEWGAWHAVEPGTNPGFLYQQNTLRDALVAGLTLNVFNRHCDRVKMANIAQLINVLQAMILTDKEKMLLTPTYHVFQMYSVHQDAILLPTELASPDYRLGEEAIPAITASASRDNEGKVHISLTNADPHRAANLSCQLDGMMPKSATGRVLTAPAINSHNTFDAPNAVQPQPLDGASVQGGKLSVTLPPKSVVVLEVL
jgi:alpha-N-arabinofuranosidase